MTKVIPYGSGLKHCALVRKLHLKPPLLSQIIIKFVGLFSRLSPIGLFLADLIIQTDSRCYVEARPIWTKGQVTLTETSNFEVRGIGQHGVL